jgi:hypothetical protein
MSMTTSLALASWEGKKTLRTSTWIQFALAASLVLSPGTSAHAVETSSAKEEETEKLAKAAQNPVADMMSFPFQDNIGLGYGPGNQGTQNVLNFQPVIPLHVTEDWNVITRTILPIVSQPSFTGGAGTTGLGDLTITAFLSPAKAEGIIWGAGPVASFPTATSPFTGSQSTWGLGPSVVVLAMPGPWVLGALVNQIWSVAGASASQMLIQYFVNYNFAGGWYLTTSPILTADWNAASGQQWVVPVGAGGGKIFRIGRLPFNGNVSAYYNAVRPDIGPEWTLRVQLALLLPTSIF